MTREHLVKQAEYLVSELNNLHSRIYILQDDMQTEADGIEGIEEQFKQHENFQDMANQVGRCRESLSDAINHLEWVMR